MKYFILLSLYALCCKSAFSQNTYYINMPTHLKDGSILYDLHVTEPDSIFNIIVSIPSEKKTGNFMFMCSRAYLKKDKGFFDNKEILSPEKVADSLAVYGRKFFRKNTFYILFNKGYYYYLHPAKGEHIYMDYSQCVEY